MDDRFPIGFAAARRVVLLFVLIFFVGAAGFFADVYYLSHATPPAALPTYAFAAFFGVVLGCFPVMSYVLARRLAKYPVAAACPACGRPIWDNLVISMNTACLKRCPRCWASLAWQTGFPLIPKHNAPVAENAQTEGETQAKR